MSSTFFVKNPSTNTQAVVISIEPVTTGSLEATGVGRNPSTTFIEHKKLSFCLIPETQE